MSPATPVILDVDPGHDDAVALVLACGAPELDVRAVTTVAGNAPLPDTTKNALLILSLIGRGAVPVGAGAEAPLARPLLTGERAHGEGGLGGFEKGGPVSEPDARGAVQVIADTIGASAEPVTLIPTGPLTNVAMFLNEHPRLKENVARIVLMGGSVGLGNVTPAAEYNIYADPEAATIVFGSGLPVTMAGLDVTERATAGPEEVERLRALGGAGALAAEIVAAYTVTHGEATGSNAPPIHDAVAVAAVIEPGILETRHVRVEIEPQGEHTRGETVCDLRGAWMDRRPNAEVGLKLDRRAFLEVLYRSVKKLDG